MNGEEEESSLIQRSRGGDVAAFNVLVERYQRGLYNLCLRMLGSAAAAEDATQDAFIAAFRRLASFRGGSFRAWLYRIAANTCYDELRRRRARPTLSLDATVAEGGLAEMAGQGPSPARQVERQETVAAIQRALDALPPDQRLAVILCDVQGMDYAEISAVTGAPLGTVKSRIARARLRLRDLLQADPALEGELFPQVRRQEDERRR
jgi:RNA polymerase sigma-70 factor (ECF subfamily)